MIRAFGLRDILRLRQLQPEGVFFNLKRQILRRPSPIRSALLGYVMPHQLGPVTRVYQLDGGRGGVGGCVQLWPREAAGSWDLAFISPALDRGEHARAVWDELLKHIAVLGAGRGVSRIHACPVEDPEAEAVLRQIGFQVVGREQVYVLERDVPDVSLPDGLEPFAGAAPELNVLYRQTVPERLRGIKGSPDGENMGIGFTFLDPGVREYVWRREGEVVAHFSLQETPRGGWLEVTFRPEHRSELLPHLRYILSSAECSAKRPIYCSVPDYAEELGWLLMMNGFEALSQQAIMEACTVVRQPVCQHVPLAGWDGSVDVTTPVGHASKSTLLDKESCIGKQEAI